MCGLRILLLFVFDFILYSYGDVLHGSFELSVIHINDFHARFEEVASNSITCVRKDPNCYGGFSRLYSQINYLKNKRPDSIVLNAGDSFQGTIWYTIYKWKAIQYFLNKIPFDVHALGNHEFDDKIAGIVPFLKGLKAPTVIANMDDTEEPTLQGLYKKSVIIERNGLKIGIIGVTTALTSQISDAGKLKFLNESESVNNEAIRLVSEDNVATIIVISHCGYEADKVIAENAAPKIGLIVGGHSHTLLYTGIPPNNLTAEGKYPTVIIHNSGRKILVVQALAFTHFLGHIIVKYNSKGEVLAWSGAPIHLDKSVSQDSDINKDINKWKVAVDEYSNTVIGFAVHDLNALFCRISECNIGSFLTDSMVYSIKGAIDSSINREPLIGLMNPGSIRNSIRAGDITIGHLIEAQPFQSTFDTALLQGKYIKEALEYSTRPASMSGRGLLQVSGIAVVYNITKALGSRVQSLKVKHVHGSETVYEDIDMEKYYNIICNSFLMNGKDGFEVISKNLINRRIGEIDSDVIERVIKKRSPILQQRDGRIRLVW